MFCSTQSRVVKSVVKIKVPLSQLLVSMASPSATVTCPWSLTHHNNRRKFFVLLFIHKGKLLNSVHCSLTYHIINNPYKMKAIWVTRLVTIPLYGRPALEARVIMCFSVRIWIRTFILSCETNPKGMHELRIFSLPIGGKVLWQVVLNYHLTFNWGMQLSMCLLFVWWYAL